MWTRDRGGRGWSQERAAAGKMERSGCIFKEAEDQTVSLYLLCLGNSRTSRLTRHANTTSGNLVSGTDLLTITGECEVKSILCWKRSLQPLTASSWRRVIVYVNAYLSWRRQGGWAAFTWSRLKGSNRQEYTLILSPWSPLLRFIPFLISPGNVSRHLAWLQRKSSIVWVCAVNPHDHCRIFRFECPVCCLFLLTFLQFSPNSLIWLQKKRELVLYDLYCFCKDLFFAFKAVVDC